MSFFGKIFTWWSGATIGTSLSLAGTDIVGEDALGNVYREGKSLPDGRRRRYVVYAGANDASRVPPEWHGWLHHQIDGQPDMALPAPRRWEKEPKPNVTGTVRAVLPAGALAAGGKRAAATGDYEPWSPEGT